MQAFLFNIFGKCQPIKFKRSYIKIKNFYLYSPRNIFFFFLQPIQNYLLLIGKETLLNSYQKQIYYLLLSIKAVNLYNKIFFFWLFKIFYSGSKFKSSVCTMVFSF